MIAVLIPTLGRPHRLRELASNVLTATVNPCRVYLIAEEHDTDTVMVGHDLEEEEDRVTLLLNRRAPNYAGAINTGYRHSTEPYVFAGADDLRFHHGWDRQVLAVMAKQRKPVGGTNDLLNPFVAQGKHATHYLVDRRYLDDMGGQIDGGPGSFLNESFDHQFTDTEFIDTARFRQLFTPCLDAVVEHLHFLNGKAPRDDTYERAYTYARGDQALYESRVHLWGGITNHPTSDVPR